MTRLFRARLYAVYFVLSTIDKITRECVGPSLQTFCLVKLFRVKSLNNIHIIISFHIEVEHLQLPSREMVLERFVIDNARLSE